MRRQNERIEPVLPNQRLPLRTRYAQEVVVAIGDARVFVQHQRKQRHAAKQGAEAPLALAQRVARVHTFSDVGGDTRCSVGSPTIVQDGKAAPLDPAHFAVRPNNAVLVVEARHAAVCKVLQCIRPVIGMDAVCPCGGLRIQAGAGPSPHRLVGVAHVEDSPHRNVVDEEHVADRLRDLPEALFALSQCQLADVAVHGVLQAAHQLTGVDLPLDQIVLRAVVQGICGKQLRIADGQYHQGNMRPGGAHAADGLRTVRVGQSEVQQDDIDAIARQVLFRFTHALHVCHFDLVRGLLLEHLAEQACVARVVLDQQQPDGGLAFHPLGLWRGSLALVSQNSLMLLTRLSKASSCTGLLR